MNQYITHFSVLWYPCLRRYKYILDCSVVFEVGADAILTISVSLYFHICVVCMIWLYILCFVVGNGGVGVVVGFLLGILVFHPVICPCWVLIFSLDFLMCGTSVLRCYGVKETLLPYVLSVYDDVLSLYAVVAVPV